MDIQEFLKNRRRFPLAELEKHAGEYVAWSPDGARIIASDDDELTLDGAIKTAGYDPEEILVTFVPHPDEVVLGGGGASE